MFGSFSHLMIYIIHRPGIGPITFMKGYLCLDQCATKLPLNSPRFILYIIIHRVICYLNTGKTLKTVWYFFKTVSDNICHTLTINPEFIVTNCRYICNILWIWEYICNIWENIGQIRNILAIYCEAIGYFSTVYDLFPCLAHWDVSIIFDGHPENFDWLVNTLTYWS